MSHQSCASTDHVCLSHSACCTLLTSRRTTCLLPTRWSDFRSKDLCHRLVRLPHAVAPWDPVLAANVARRAVLICTPWASAPHPSQSFSTSPPAQIAAFLIEAPRRDKVCQLTLANRSPTVLSATERGICIAVEDQICGSCVDDMWHHQPGTVPYGPIKEWPTKFRKPRLLKGNVKTSFAKVHSKSVRANGDLPCFFTQFAGSECRWKLDALKQRLEFPKIKDIENKDGTWARPPFNTWFYVREVPVEGQSSPSKTEGGNWLTTRQLFAQLKARVCAPSRIIVFM